MNTMGVIAPSVINNLILLLTIVVPAVYWTVQGIKKVVSK